MDGMMSRRGCCWGQSTILRNGKVGLGDVGAGMGKGDGIGWGLLHGMVLGALGAPGLCVWYVEGVTGGWGHCRHSGSARRERAFTKLHHTMRLMTSSWGWAFRIGCIKERCDPNVLLLRLLTG